MKTIGYAAKKKNGSLEPLEIERRQLQDKDVLIEILYCGLCHSDIHFIENEWHSTKYPVVPGHEIVGKVVKTGILVTDYKVGDIVIPNGIIDTCGSCYQCLHNLEQYCQKGYTFMYNTTDKFTGNVNYGGFAKYIVAQEHYMIKVPAEIGHDRLAQLAPLGCAGITVYSPLKHWKIGKGHKIAVVGIGGLGHMAIKFARAFGAEVTAITTSEDKVEDALRFGACRVIVSTNEEVLSLYQYSFDFIINTIPVAHKIAPYIQLLSQEGTMCMIGVYEKPDFLPPFDLMRHRRSITGSVLGSMHEIKEMLDFCIEHNIFADIQEIPMEQVNDAIENVKNKKARYRYVVDMASL